MPITLKRTIWPVGHGAFYTEQFIEEPSGKILWTAVYDCGGKDESTIKNAIDDFLTDCSARQGVSKPTIDYVFISHLHNDHINGLEYLRQNANIKHLALPQLTNNVVALSVIETVAKANAEQNDSNKVEILHNIDTIKLLQNRDFGDTHIVEVRQTEPQDEYPNNDRPNNNDEQQVFEGGEGKGVSIIDSGTKIQIAGLSATQNARVPYWVYVPVNIYATQPNLLQNLFGVGNLNIPLNNIMTGNNIDIDKLSQAIENIPTATIDAAYRNVFAYQSGKAKDANIYSMPVYSGIDTQVLLNDTAIYDIYTHHDINNFFYRHLHPYPYRYWHRQFLLFKRSLCCLYMGDYRAQVKKNMMALVNSLHHHWDMVGTQQVPHHFSSHNHNANLYNDVKITFGNIDDHGDISFTHSIAQDISMRCWIPPLIVTEKSRELEFCYVFGL